MQRFGRVRQLCLILAGALVLLAGAAQAFTFTDQNGNNGGNAQGYLDLDTKSSRSDQSSPSGGSDGNKMQWGNSSVQFGAGSLGGPRGFGQRYNNDNLFNPYWRDGR